MTRLGVQYGLQSLSPRRDIFPPLRYGDMAQITRRVGVVALTRIRSRALGTLCFTSARSSAKPHVRARRAAKVGASVPSPSARRCRHANLGGRQVHSSYIRLAALRLAGDARPHPTVVLNQHPRLVIPFGGCSPTAAAHTRFPPCCIFPSVFHEPLGMFSTAARIEATSSVFLQRSLAPLRASLVRETD